MARRGALALASWATATLVASIASVAGISLVTTQVTRPPLPTGSASAAPAASGAVPVRVSTGGAGPDPASPDGPVHATFGSPSGVVGAACDGDVISLTSAAPAPGHRFTIVAGGPDVVEVSFTGDHLTGTRLACVDGVPVEQPAGGAARSSADVDVAAADEQSDHDHDHDDHDHDGPFVPTWADRHGDDRDGRGDDGRRRWDHDARPDEGTTRHTGTDADEERRERSDSSHDSDEVDAAAQDGGHEGTSDGRGEPSSEPGDHGSSSGDHRDGGRWHDDDRHHHGRSPEADSDARPHDDR